MITPAADELHPLGQIHGVVADALQVLDDHEQIQGGIHLAGVGGDLLRQRMLDGVEIVVHLIVGGNDPEGGLLILRGQGIQASRIILCAFWPILMAWLTAGSPSLRTVTR